MNLKNRIFKGHDFADQKVKQNGESCFSYITDMPNVSIWQVYSTCIAILSSVKCVDKIMQIISLDANPEPENPIQFAQFAMRNFVCHETPYASHNGTHCILFVKLICFLYAKIYVLYSVFFAHGVSFPPHFRSCRRADICFGKDLRGRLLCKTIFAQMTDRTPSEICRFLPSSQIFCTSPPPSH